MLHIAYRRLASIELGYVIIITSIYSFLLSTTAMRKILFTLGTGPALTGYEAKTVV